GANGIYALQAAIAALHANARTAAETDWPQIAALYAALLRINPSPVIEINLAVAVAMARTPEDGLPLLDDIESRGEPVDFHLLYCARADLLGRIGRISEAIEAYRRALSLATNDVERRFLLRRIAELSVPS